MAHLVYLAGPIKGLSFDDSVNWRAQAEKVLGEVGIGTLNPMRFKDYLKDEQNLQEIYPNHHLSTSKSIVSRDTHDIRRVDIVLANFVGAQSVSIGTSCEVGYAYALGVPIVTALEPGSLHDHCFIREMSSYVVPSVAEALELTAQILLTKPAAKTEVKVSHTSEAWGNSVLRKTKVEW